MHNLLATMGIPLWRQRSVQEAEVILPESAPPPQFVLVVELAQADRPLLANIIKALACPEDKAQVIWVDSPSNLQNQVWPEAPTIVFGEALYPYVPTKAIRTVSLTALNHNIPAKKVLWQQLKALV